MRINWLEVERRAFGVWFALVWWIGFVIMHIGVGVISAVRWLAGFRY